MMKDILHQKNNNGYLNKISNINLRGREQYIQCKMFVGGKRKELCFSNDQYLAKKKNL